MKRKLEQEDRSKREIVNGWPGATDQSGANLPLGMALDELSMEAKVATEQPIKTGDKVAAKAARQAKKAKRKRQAQAQDTNGAVGEEEDASIESTQARETGSSRAATAQTVDVVNGVDTLINDRTDAKVARKEGKEKRKRLKAATKAQDETTSETIPTTGSSGVNGLPTPSGRRSNTTSLLASYVEDTVLASLPQAEIDSFLSANFISITDPSSPTALRPIIDFTYLPKAISANSPFAAFKAPTPIQAAAWPFLLSNRDVIGVAETGSGKTLAFGVPCIRSIIDTLSSKPKSKPVPVRSAGTKAVVVSPTRELAVQIHEQLEKLAAPAHLSTACVYGGVPKDPQRLAVKTAHIIVATPGRLNDLIEEGAANLSGVKYLVLDEADRMLDKGFEDAIRTIISCTPSTASGRQTLMFTATWPPSVRELASTFMNQPVHIAIGDNNPSGELRANKSITQKVEVVEPEAKQSRLLQIIKQHQGTAKTKNDRILVFCLYKKEATRIEGYLHSKGLRVAGIHGDLNQQKRTDSLEAFKSGSCPLLVATDVAARGLDIPAVKLVLNVTFPLTVEDYVHRIGRTGRAGAAGLAITLFTVHDKAQSGALINVLRAAGQEIPGELLKFGTTVKKKAHETYGAFVKDLGEGPRRGTKIRFD